MNKRFILLVVLLECSFFNISSKTYGNTPNVIEKTVTFYSMRGVLYDAPFSMNVVSDSVVQLPNMPKDTKALLTEICANSDFHPDITSGYLYSKIADKGDPYYGVLLQGELSEMSENTSISCLDGSVVDFEITTFRGLFWVLNIQDVGWTSVEPYETVRFKNQDTVYLLKDIIEKYQCDTTSMYSYAYEYIKKAMRTTNIRVSDSTYDLVRYWASNFMVGKAVLREPIYDYNVIKRNRWNSSRFSEKKSIQATIKKSKKQYTVLFSTIDNYMLVAEVFPIEHENMPQSPPVYDMMSHYVPSFHFLFVFNGDGSVKKAIKIKNQEIIRD